MPFVMLTFSVFLYFSILFLVSLEGIKRASQPIANYSLNKQFHIQIEKINNEHMIFLIKFDSYVFL